MTHPKYLEAAADRANRAHAETAEAKVQLENAMRQARRQGVTLAAIAEIVGISRQRVAQILEKRPLPPPTPVRTVVEKGLTSGRIGTQRIRKDSAENP